MSRVKQTGYWNVIETKRIKRSRYWDYSTKDSDEIKGNRITHFNNNLLQLPMAM